MWGAQKVICAFKLIRIIAYYFFFVVVAVFCLLLLKIHQTVITSHATFILLAFWNGEERAYHVIFHSLTLFARIPKQFVKKIAMNANDKLETKPSSSNNRTSNNSYFSSEL